MKLTKRITRLLSVTIAASFLLMPSAHASIPYDGYTYNTLEQDIRSIAGFAYDSSIDGLGTPWGALNRPESIFINESDELYIVDSGNNRIVHLDANEQLIRIYGDDDGPGKLNEPKGVYVKADGTVYVADTKSQRIVLFNADGSVLRELLRPDSPLMGSTFSYSPSKIVLDKRDYMFVVSDGSTQGLLQIDPDGDFKGFFGANHVGFSWGRLFTKMLATEEQRRRMLAIRPAEYSSLDIDDEGFIYTTTLGEDFNQLKRLSPVGVDTLNFNIERPYGDVYSVGPFLMASFIGVTVSDEGIISALDLQTSKVFQYDKLGNFLFSFGGTGEQNGLFVTPADLDQDSHGNIYVVDRGRHRVDKFRTTPFADLVQQASILFVDGRYEEAEVLWHQVLEVNGNYDMAYLAIGKSLYKAERYKEAMHYFKLSRAKHDYSLAFKEYRREVIRDYFAYFFIGAIIALILLRWGTPRLIRTINRKLGMEKLHVVAAERKKGELH